MISRYSNLDTKKSLAKNIAGITSENESEMAERMAKK
jgi:hypothetical protein